MTTRVGKILLSLALVLFTYTLQAQKIYASSSCTLCILEVGVSSEMGESYDYVIIGNSTASSISLSSVQLQYFNSLGVYDSRVNLSGTLAAGQMKVYVSSDLKTYNPSSSILPFSIYSGGGSLVLEKVLSASTTTYDTVGWGDSSLFETSKIETGTSSIFHRKLTSLGAVVDLGNNGSDFISEDESCSGLKFNEIQPFATDVNGAAVETWTELNYSLAPMNSCYIATSSNYYELGADIYSEPSGLLLISSINTGGIENFIELPNPSGSLAVAISSFYVGDRPVFVPSSEIIYADLVKSQSYGLFDLNGSPTWKATYEQTPGEANLLQLEPTIVVTGSPDACASIIINEIVPNPLGSDTDREWIEIFNSSNEPHELGQCIIGIESEKYYFLAGMIIGPSEYQKYDSLYTEDGLEKSLSLRNTDETYVNMSRLYGDILSSLQSFTYSDALEGMSYSRFEEGWAWTYEMTPSSQNIYQPIKPSPIITETKAFFATSTSSPKVTVTTVKPKTTTTKKSQTSAASTKSLASTAKSTTGAKTTESRDVYVEPESVNSNSSSYVFVVIGVMAVIYALYEYKVDIQNFYIKRRGNKILSSENRPAD